MNAAARAALQAGLAGLELAPDAAREAQLAAYVDALLRWNARTNLTAITDPLEIVRKHLLDCLAALPPQLPATVCDVGSGAGLPGLLWARERPDTVFTSVDARGKKIAFQQAVAGEWGLRNFRARHARVEDVAGPFEAVVCRAFAPLERLLPLVAPLLAAGGCVLALKGPGVAEELAAVEGSGWRYTIEPVSVPGLSAQRTLLRLTRPDEGDTPTASSPGSPA